MMLISRCTSLKMMKLEKEAERLRVRFYSCLLFLLASSFLFFSASFFVGCHVRGCLACVANEDTSECISTGSWLGGWGWECGWGWEGQRVTVRFILCTAVYAEKRMCEKSCIVGAFVCDGNFWPVFPLLLSAAFPILRFQNDKKGR